MYIYGIFKNSVSIDVVGVCAGHSPAMRSPTLSEMAIIQSYKMSCLHALEYGDMKGSPGCHHKAVFVWASYRGGRLNEESVSPRWSSVRGCRRPVSMAKLFRKVLSASSLQSYCLLFCSCRLVISRKKESKIEKEFSIFSIYIPTADS